MWARKKDPVWRVVVADQRSPRDGRVIETIGHYNAQTEPSTVVIDEERARAWIERGAQPTSAVRKLLRISESGQAAVAGRCRRAVAVSPARRTRPLPRADPAASVEAETPSRTRARPRERRNSAGSR